MVEHIVLIKLTETASSSQIDELIRRTKLLKEEIPGIADIQQGRNFSNRNQGFDIGLTIRFENKEALERFGPHPKHQEVVSLLQEMGLVEVIVVDFEFDS